MYALEESYRILQDSMISRVKDWDVDTIFLISEQMENLDLSYEGKIYLLHALTELVDNRDARYVSEVLHYMKSIYIDMVTP
jgi:hypothetical protein